MQVTRKCHIANIILSSLIALFLIGLPFNTDPCLVSADSTPDRTPTFSTTHGTATADELVAAMDISEELVISSSLARASSVHQPVLNFPLDTSSRKWYLSQGAKSSYSHYGSSAYALDFTDTVKEQDGTIVDLTGVEDVPILAAAGGEVVGVVWDKTGKAPVAAGDPGNYVKIYHGDGFTTSYCHLQYDSIPLSLHTIGAPVKSGQFLGYMGNTGSTTGGPTEGTHLHFAVKYKYLGDQASAILDKAMLAGRLITGYVEGQFYPDSADFSDKVGAHVLNTFDCFSSGFPISGNTYAVISTGNAADAPKPNTEGSLSTELDDLDSEQGNDLVQLSVTLEVPPGTQGWLVDWKFLSEEFPEWVGSQYNDAFLIETPFSKFQISGFATVEAPNNVALDPDGDLVCVNTVGVVGMSGWNAMGTTYDGATATLTAGAPVPAGAEIITIVFSVMDLGDSIYDTAVFLDNFRFINPIHVPMLDNTSFYAHIPPEQVQVVFSTSWEGSDVVMTLIDPFGGIIDRNTVAPDVVHDVGPDFETYTIFDPVSGDWLVDLYGADVPPEGEDVEFRLMFSTVPPINVPPVAEAGPDQKLCAIPPATTAMVTFDGSGSYDPDGDPLTYTWSWGNNTAHGMSPTVELPSGITTIILVVNDGKVDSLPDTLDVTVSIPATIDFDPDTLNLKGKGQFVTAYIELPPGHDVSQIDISSISLNATVPALTKPTKVGDYDRDGIPDLMVKFDRATVQALLTSGSQVEITITGEVAGIVFEGSDTIRVIDPSTVAIHLPVFFFMM